MSTDEKTLQDLRAEYTLLKREADAVRNTAEQFEAVADRDRSTSPFQFNDRRKEMIRAFARYDAARSREETANGLVSVGTDGPADRSVRDSLGQADAPLGPGEAAPGAGGRADGDGAGSGVAEALTFLIDKKAGSLREVVEAHTNPYQERLDLHMEQISDLQQRVRALEFRPEPVVTDAMIDAFAREWYGEYVDLGSLGIAVRDLAREAIAAAMKAGAK